MKQGTEEWLHMRKFKVGASDAPIILGLSPWTSVTELWEQKLGLRSPKTKSVYMQRGIDLEQTARDYFYLMIGIQVVPKTIFHHSHSWMMASLDGLSFNKKTLVEIKCPGKKDHETALAGQVPEKYYPQLQHQLEVCQLDKMFYLSFDGKEGTILEVFRNETYIQKMVALEQNFWSCLQNFVPPDEKAFKLS